LLLDIGKYFTSNSTLDHGGKGDTAGLGETSSLKIFCPPGEGTDDRMIAGVLLSFQTMLELVALQTASYPGLQDLELSRTGI